MANHSIRSRLATCASALVVATVLLAPASGQAGYVLTEFSIAGAASTALWDVNNHGAMVGYSLDASGNGRGFVRASDGTITTLAGPGGAVSTNALGISDGGIVVGAFNAAGSAQRGFIFSSGSYTVFEVAGAQSTILRGISPDGRYLSGYYTTSTNAGIAFAYDRVTGILRSVPEPATSSTTIGQGVTNAGVMVGSDIIDSPPSRPGFIYDSATGTRTDVMLAGATRTALRAIDDSGVLSGWFIDATGTHGFVGSLSSYETIDFAGATQTFVEGSNNSRWLVGEWFDAAGAVRAFIATPIPTPGSLALALAALAALGWTGQRRRAPG